MKPNNTPTANELIRSELYRSRIGFVPQYELGLEAIFQKRINDGYQLNKRVKIDTGKFCNARCKFCYYIDRVKERDFLTIEEVQDHAFIEKLLADGIREFEFSGGEPTTCWDLLPITEYIIYIAREMFQIPREDLHFSVVTNGYLLRDKYKAEKVRDHKQVNIYGPQFKHIEEILFSLHGNKSLHNKTTGLAKSFDRIIDFIDEWLNEKDNPTEPTYLLQYVSKIRINVVVQENTFTGEEGNSFALLLCEYMSRGIQVNLLPHNTWDASNIDKEQSQSFFERIRENISMFLDVLDVRFPMLEQNNKRYWNRYNSNLFNIRYYSPCQITKTRFEKYRKYVVSHFDHLFDCSDWNKYYYPHEAYIEHMDKTLKNIFPSDKMTDENLLLKYLDDANQSHFVDKTCANCKDFINLKCDGQKYTNQKTKEINYITTDLRKDYVNRKHES